MGKKMNKKMLYISFEPVRDGFSAFLPIDEVLNDKIKHNQILSKSEVMYSNFIEKSRQLLKEVDERQKNERQVNARLIWTLGDSIFKLTNDFKNIGVNIDRIYEHLSRDLNKHPKWLQHTVSFRRYIDKISIIPKDQNWGLLSKAIKRNSLKLIKGILQ